MVPELQEAVRRLHNIRKAEKELAGSKRSLQWTHSPRPNSQKLPHWHTQKGRRANNAEEWKLAMARTCRRKRLPPKPEVPLQNRFTALQTEERPVTSGEALEPGKAARSAPCIKNSTTEKRQRVIVVGDSLLRGTEAPIC